MTDERLIESTQVSFTVAPRRGVEPSLNDFNESNLSLSDYKLHTFNE